MTKQILDCIIIGAGPAGFTAAIYLARFRRKIMVLHHNKSRACLIPILHIHPGFPDEVPGQVLLDSMTIQAQAYNTSIFLQQVRAIERQASDFFSVATEQFFYQAKYIVLATGIADVMSA
jgi:thioredoxin reductase (NADPH)